MNNLKQLQYPIFISTTEFIGLFNIKKTKLYSLINQGELKTAKVGTRTLILFSSAIAYASRAIEQGNQNFKFNADLSEFGDPKSQEIANILLHVLYNTHSQLDNIDIGNIQNNLNNEIVKPNELQGREKSNG